MTTLPRTRVLVAAFAATGLLLSACGSDDDAASTTAAAATNAPDVQTDTSVSASAAPLVENAWARTSPAMATMGAAYMTITSEGGDRLVAASVDTSIAGAVEIHEVVPADQAASGMDHMGDDEHGSMDGESMDATGDTMAPAMAPSMVMQPIEGLDLPAGTAVELRPGGYHIMLVDLVAPLEVGSTLTLTLTFEQAGDVVLDVPVLDEAP